MKKTNKIFSVILALALVFAMAIPAFAASTWTGDITINSATNVSVDGKVFKAYKILDAEAVDADNLEAGVIYSIPEALQSFYNTKFGGDDKVATVDEVTTALEGLKDKAAELQAFAVEALAAAKAAGISPASATGANDKATFTDLDFGYYVIEDEGTATPISALMLRTTSAEVTLKADKPSIEKKIDGDTDKDDTTAGLVDYNTATVGESVPYVLTSKVPDMTGYTKYTYTVTDTLSDGLTFNNDVVVTVGGEKYTDVAVSTNGQVVTINFTNFINLADKAGEEIKITYSAKVNENAIIGVEGNPNSVVLEYSNNPQDTTDTDTTEKDITRTYLVDLIINKTDEDNKALAGAEFAVKDADGNTIATGTSDDNGKVAFTWTNGVGLKDGETYTIVETKAPAGYNEAKDITFTVTCTDPTTGTDCTWSSDNTLVTFTATDGADVDDYFETTIKNTTGSLLPETGGIGTTIFYIVGALLVVGAVVILISKKRTSAEA
ncbi:MAG: SpaH/EbpB family LPXTG-anchored major pilin [Clostridia bacterium]|nr:SpaH/EbpB family LPXTG-anchored major pilin [Clostridia bacterium]